MDKELCYLDHADKRRVVTCLVHLTDERMSELEILLHHLLEEVEGPEILRHRHFEKEPRVAIHPSHQKIKKKACKLFKF